MKEGQKGSGEWAARLNTPCERGPWEDPEGIPPTEAMRGELVRAGGITENLSGCPSPQGRVAGDSRTEEAHWFNNGDDRTHNMRGQPLYSGIGGWTDNCPNE